MPRDPYRHARMVAEEGLLGRRFLPFQNLLTILVDIAAFAHRRLAPTRKFSLFLDGDDDGWRIRDWTDAQFSNALHELDLQLHTCEELATTILPPIQNKFPAGRVKLGRVKRSTAIAALVDAAKFVATRAGKQLRDGSIKGQSRKTLEAICNHLCLLPEDTWVMINHLHKEKQALSGRQRLRVEDHTNWQDLTDLGRNILAVAHHESEPLPIQRLYYLVTMKAGRATGGFRSLADLFVGHGFLIKAGPKNCRTYAPGHRPPGMPGSQLS